MKGTEYYVVLSIFGKVSMSWNWKGIYELRLSQYFFNDFWKSFIGTA